MEKVVEMERRQLSWQRGFPEQVSRWRQAAQDANAKPVLTMAEQKELEKLRAQDQRQIKALKKELQRKEKAMAYPTTIWLRGRAKQVDRS